MEILVGVLNVLWVVSSLFMICLVLIQRGKGGGLAGAFGGAGGSSAFGTKAGDVFTRVTILAACVWILLAMILVILSSRGHEEGAGFESAVESRAREAAKKGEKGAPKVNKSDTTAPKSTNDLDLPPILPDAPKPKQ